MNRDEQERHLFKTVTDNPVNAQLLKSLCDDAVPIWFLTGGCVCQTMWNYLTGRSIEHGILDYDVFYFDSSDLSYEAEDDAVRKALGVIGAEASI